MRLCGEGFTGYIIRCKYVHGVVGLRPMKNNLAFMLTFQDVIKILYSFMLNCNLQKIKEKLFKSK